MHLLKYADGKAVRGEFFTDSAKAAEAAGAQRSADRRERRRSRGAPRLRRAARPGDGRRSRARCPRRRGSSRRGAGYAGGWGRSFAPPRYRAGRCRRRPPARAAAEAFAHRAAEETAQRGIGDERPGQRRPGLASSMLASPSRRRRRSRSRRPRSGDAPASKVPSSVFAVRAGSWSRLIFAARARISVRAPQATGRQLGGGQPARQQRDRRRQGRREVDPDRGEVGAAPQLLHLAGQPAGFDLAPSRSRRPRPRRRAPPPRPTAGRRNPGSRLKASVSVSQTRPRAPNISGRGAKERLARTPRGCSITSSAPVTPSAASSAARAPTAAGSAAVSSLLRGPMKPGHIP